MLHRLNVVGVREATKGGSAVPRGGNHGLEGNGSVDGHDDFFSFGVDGVGVLEGELVQVNHLLDDVVPMLGLGVVCKQLVSIIQLVLNRLVFTIKYEFGLLHQIVLSVLGIEHLEGWVISEVEVRGNVGQGVVGLPHLVATMGVGAVLAKATLALSKEVLTLLGFEVVVGNVHHLELHFQRQSIFFFAQFNVSMGEVAGLSFGTVFALLEVLAELGLKQIIELLSAVVLGVVVVGVCTCFVILGVTGWGLPLVVILHLLLLCSLHLSSGI